ncbi:MAG: T9SS type A sorting domain-containing protein [bacterium]
MRKFIFTIMPVFLVLMAASLYSQDHLVISELVVTPTNGEYIEIYNPTGATVDLTNYYVTDGIFSGDPHPDYVNIVDSTDTAFGFDFLARFPAGASIASSEYQIIALNSNFSVQYGFDPDYEMSPNGVDDGDAVPDMLNGGSGIGSNPGLSNSGEVVILFWWDGISDLVSDVDIALWGDKAEGVDKTDVKKDSKTDADADSTTYAADTPIANQSVIAAGSHTFGKSWQRPDPSTEVGETTAGGNGITGHDETSEDLASAFVEGAPSPGAGLSVEVTFWMNTATVPDTVTPNSSVQIRGGTPPLTWGDDTGGVLEHVQGDLWKKSLMFPAGAQVDYKFNVRTDLTEGGDGWESNVNTANTNRNLTVPFADTTLQVQFYNTTTGNDPLFRPYPETDSLDVYLRVNMQGFANFNPATQFVAVRGAFPESAGWSTNILLTQETGSDNAGQFNYPAGQFWSGATKIDPAAFNVGDTLKYKFVTLNAADPGEAVVNWEDNISDRIFVVPTKDTTVVWDFFDKQAPIRATNSDTVDVTFMVDMTRAINSRGFTPGDTVRARIGFAGTANEGPIDVELFNLEGTSFWTGRDTIVATIGSILEYDYVMVKFGQIIRESFFDFDFVPEDESQQGRAERRRADIPTAAFTITDDSQDEFSPRRQPFFPSNQTLSQDVLVTWEVDMRPAIFELLFSNPTDTLFDIQGNRDIFDPADVLASGVWINGLATGGWQTWGATLEADDTRKMYDDGTNGDAVAGDSIFTRQILFSPDSIGIGSKGVVGQVYKFGIRGGDNEGGFGNNHVANIDDSNPTFTIRTQFGSIDPKKYDHWDYTNQVPNPTSVELISDNLPATFELHQNYPNPFNPETAIRYAIPKSGEVRLTVYNLLGQKVATLVDKNQVAGSYLAKWNGQNDAGNLVSSGVYIYKIEVGKDFVDTRKMLFLK